jgi:hypothetical protein
MIDWGQILYGAALTTVFAAVVLALIAWRRRVPVIILPGLLVAFLGPLTWNAMLHRAATDADAFFVDIPFKPFPVSWQDTGTGIVTLALGSIVLGLTFRRQLAGQVLALGVTIALVAFLTDIYCY